MKEVFVKYNPYKLETEITINGEKPAENSEILRRYENGARLQEWIGEFPSLLLDEYNDKNYKIAFHGTQLDFEDLVDIFSDAEEKGIIQASLEHIPAKETSDKEALIDEVFEEIQKGPIEDLRDQEIISAFNHAKSSDFEVCIVATMSSGKSTLINAMLGAKLMPSKQEACTAIITRVKDVGNGEIPWRAEVYNKEGELIETHQNLKYDEMVRLNSDEKVSLIKAEGNIPFVETQDISLVIIDTPGPNNSRDPEHRRIQSEFLGKSSKSLVLYIMTGEFGTDDDEALLKTVSESMSVGGKQSKDRFIFVINKLDDRKKEDGPTDDTLNRIRSYLKKHGIENPNMFPAAALPALNIRMMENNDSEIDEDTIDDTEVKIKRLNKRENLHFEKYASLPSSIHQEIENRLIKAESNGKDEEHNLESALIHTGIPSVEAAIRQYVRKYAKTAKIKNIADTFTHKLEEARSFEKLTNELANNDKEREKILQSVDRIRKNVDDIKGACNFKKAVDDAVKNVNKDSKEIVDKIIIKFQGKITERIDKIRDEKLSLDDAEEESKKLREFAEKLETDFKVELDELIHQKLVKVSETLLNEYKQKLASIAEEMNLNNDSKIQINPLKLMKGSVESINLDNLIQNEEVEDGTERVKNQNKKWYKPWTWFAPKFYDNVKYKNVQYIQGSDLAAKLFEPIQSNLYENGDAAQEQAENRSKEIAKRFEEEFAKLDKKLKDKLSDLDSCLTDEKKAEERIKDSERKIAWLEDIQAKVNSILEI